MFVDAVIKITLFIETQEGKVCMDKKDYFDTLGATASCVMQAVDAGQQFSGFNNLSLFKEYAHGNKPRLNDPPSDNGCLLSKACSSTEK